MSVAPERLLDEFGALPCALPALPCHNFRRSYVAYSDYVDHQFKEEASFVFVLCMSRPIELASDCLLIKYSEHCFLNLWSTGFNLAKIVADYQLMLIFIRRLLNFALFIVLIFVT